MSQGRDKYGHSHYQYKNRKKKRSNSLSALGLANMVKQQRKNHKKSGYHAKVSICPIACSETHSSALFDEAKVLKLLRCT